MQSFYRHIGQVVPTRQTALYLMKCPTTYSNGLQTVRLRTRLLTSHDIPAWACFFESEAATRHLATFGTAACSTMSKYWIEKQLARYSNNQFGLQAVLHRASGEMVGHAGLLTQVIDGTQELEISYHIIEKYWGQGFATEAARAFVAYAFFHHLAPSVIAIIDIHNIRSQRVAQKLGFKKEAQTVWAYHDVFMFRLKQDKWNNITTLKLPVT